MSVVRVTALDLPVAWLRWQDLSARQSYRGRSTSVIVRTSCLASAPDRRGGSSDPPSILLILSGDSPADVVSSMAVFDAIKNHPIWALLSAVGVLVVGAATIWPVISHDTVPEAFAKWGIRPSWYLLGISLIFLASALVASAGVFLIALKWIGSVNSRLVMINLTTRKQRVGVVVAGVVLVTMVAVGWIGAFAGRAAASTGPPLTVNARIAEEYSPELQKCISENKPDYVVESVTYVMRVERNDKELSELHRHSYTIRALRDFESPIGNGFYDVFSLYVSDTPRWREWRTGLFTQKVIDRPKYYPPNDRVVGVAFSMKQGERLTIPLGFDVSTAMPLALPYRADDPLDDSPTGQLRSRIYYNNARPESAPREFVTDCVGEVKLLVESASLNLVPDLALRLNFNRRTTARDTVRVEQRDGERPYTVLAFSWKHLVPGERVLYYFHW